MPATTSERLARGRARLTRPGARRGRNLVEDDEVMLLRDAWQLQRLDAVQPPAQQADGARGAARFLLGPVTLHGDALTTHTRQRQQKFRQRRHARDRARQHEVVGSALGGHLAGLLGAGVQGSDFRQLQHLDEMLKEAQLLRGGVQQA